MNGSSFKALEQTAAECVIGVSCVASSLLAMKNILGTYKAEDKTSSANFTLNENVNTESLAVVYKSLSTAIELLESQVTNQRVQLAAVYRGAYLEQSGFHDDVKANLRSLPTSKDSLFHKPWIEHFVKKLKSTNKSTALNKVVTTQSRPHQQAAKRKARNQLMHQNKKRSKPNPVNKPQKDSSQNFFSGDRGRGRGGNRGGR